MAYQQLSERLRQLKPDLTIKCSDGEVMAVKMLIMTASSPLNTMLSSFKEGVENVINFAEESRSTIAAFVNYVQYGDITSDLETLCHLSTFLDKYTVDQVKIMELLAELAKNHANAVIIMKLCTMDCHYDLRRSASMSFCTDAFHSWHHVCNECGTIGLPKCTDCKEVPANSNGFCSLMGHNAFKPEAHPNCKKLGQYVPTRKCIKIPEDDAILAEMVRVYIATISNTPIVVKNAK